MKLILVDLDINNANITLKMLTHVVYIQYMFMLFILVPFLQIFEIQGVGGSAYIKHLHTSPVIGLSFRTKKNSIN